MLLPLPGSPRRLHPALALLCAGGVHAGLFAALYALAPDLPAGVGMAAQLRETPIELIELLPAAPHPEPAAALSRVEPRAGSAPAAPRRRPRTPVAGEPVGDEQGEEGSAAALEGPDVEADAALPAAEPSRPIDLGLNGGIRRAATLEGWLEPAPAPAPPSVGGLVEGLAALDAARGLSRSSAASHAAYTAARRAAPAQGIGVFDISTNEHGVVLSVTLVSAGSDQGSWERVGQELHALLKDRPLRVPPGAKGLLARLRIERGELSLEPSERGRTERGVALGQAPLHVREQPYESTRASLESGQLSPTLAVPVAGGGSGDRIRVVLVSERAL